MNRLKLGILILSCVFLMAPQHNNLDVPYIEVVAPRQVYSGDAITVDIVLNLNGYSSFGHEFSIQFTPDVLAVESAIELGAPPHELNLSPGVASVNNVVGIIEQFEAASLNWEVDGEFLVGQVTFLAGEPGKATISVFFHRGAAVLDNQYGVIDEVVFIDARVNVKK